MAETRLSDLIEPAKFTSYVQNRTKELSALYQSGVIGYDERVAQAAAGGGATINMPFWNDLTGNESNIGSDDPTDEAVPQKIDASQDVAVMHYRNNAWSSMDLSAVIAGDDPMQRIGDRVATYWTRDMQRTLIATLNGVIADNEANDSGDFVHNIATDAATTPTDDELFGPKAVVQGALTMGDASEDLVALAMHSVPYARLQELDLIEYRNTALAGSKNSLRIPYYLDKRVVVDDGCPAIAGTNRITYTSYLFGPGAVAQADSMPRTPHAVEREERKGGGEGMETLHSRKHFVLHPRGVKFVSGAVAGKSPTNAELSSALNWDRVYERKLVRFAAIKTNG